MKRTPLSPMSAKRRAALKTRTTVRQQVLERDDHRCQFWAHADAANPVDYPLACTHDLEVHEIIPRSAWSDGWLHATNCITLCHRHHQWVTEHPEAAHTIGLRNFSWQRDVE